MQSYYNIPIDEQNYGEGAKVLSNSNYYWVAARVCSCFSDFTSFDLRLAGTDVRSSIYMSGRGNFSSNNRVRAVVSLGSSVQINANTGESPENAHTIEW